MSELDHGGLPAASVPVVISYGRHAPDEPLPIAPSQNLDTVETETRHYRHDGWTPALRAAFLDMLAKSGIVTDACREVQRSAQAAYALRNRDRLFAAGWDAALSMARARLADEVYHRAINGTVDQIWKDGEIVAERHRHDNRLSMAVLSRLDARCDRAERTAAPAQRIAAEWETYLAALAEDRIADAEKLLEPPAPAPVHAMLGHGSDAKLIHQLHQLRAGKALDETGDFAADDEEDATRVWIEEGQWRTSFPPPTKYRGKQDGAYGDQYYSRPCSPGECALLDARYPDAFAEEEDNSLEADETERDLYFASLTAAAEDETVSAESKGGQESAVVPRDGENA